MFFRSVRRWKDKLGKMDEKDTIPDDDTEDEMLNKSDTILQRPKREAALKVPKVEEDDDEYLDEVERPDESEEPKRKKRRLYVDREKVQYARELIENKLSNKEMSMLLELSLACVRKLKMKILNGTVEELIDDSEEHYSKMSFKIKEECEDIEAIDPDTDPLHQEQLAYLPVASTSTSAYGYERKPKVVLKEREMFMVRLLRENNIRTMDIAKMMKISERSVTRLLAKSKDMEVIEYEADLVAEVDRMILEKDQLLSAEMMPQMSEQDLDPMPSSYSDRTSGDDANKIQLCNSLLAMNVKIKDIAKMLDVTEKTIQRWKLKAGGGQHPVFNDLIETKQEYEEYGEYE
jgi:predicted transcriptional regulator